MLAQEDHCTHLWIHRHRDKECWSARVRARTGTPIIDKCIEKPCQNLTNMYSVFLKEIENDETFYLCCSASPD